MTEVRIQTAWGDVVDFDILRDGDVMIGVKGCVSGRRETAKLSMFEFGVLAQDIAKRLQPDTVRIEVGNLPPVEDGDWGNVLPILLPQGEIVRVEPVRTHTGKLAAVKVSVRQDGTTVETISSPDETIEVIRNEAVDGMEFL